MSKHNPIVEIVNPGCKSNAIRLNQITKIALKHKKKFQNTLFICACSYTKTTEKETLDLVKHHKNVRNIIIYGCLPQKTIKLLPKNVSYFKEIEELLKYYNISDKISNSILPSNHKEKLNMRKPVKIVLTILDTILPGFKKTKYYKRIAAEFFNSNYPHIQISTGCSNCCTYCIIHKMKAKNCTSPEEILSEIKLYSGRHPIVLVGDDCGQYNSQKHDFDHLLTRIIKKFPKRKFSICYLHPKWIEQNNYILKHTQNIESLTIPIQSGSKKILHKMNRNYNPDKVLAELKKIKKKNPKIILRNHLIVGFPREGFSDLIKTIRTIPTYDTVNIFRYSEREGTKSSKLKEINPLKKELFFYTMYLLTRLHIIQNLTIEWLKSKFLKQSNKI